MDITSKSVILNSSSYFNVTANTTLQVAAGFNTSEQVVFTIVFLVFILVSVLGNGIVCFLVYRKPAMRSAINVLLANLTLCDALLSALCVPFDVLTLATNRWLFGKIFCGVHAALQNVLIFDANILLLIISIDRYLIIVHKRDNLKQFHAKILIIASWLFGIFLLFPPVFGWWANYDIRKRQSHCHLVVSSETSSKRYVLIVFLCMYVLPYVFMICIYICILHTLKRASRRINCQPGYFITDRSSSTKRFSVGTTIYTQDRVRVDYGFKTRTFSTILLIFLANAVCKTPQGVISFRWSYSNADATSSYIYVLFLLYLNQVLNPLIYLLKIGRLRAAFWEFFPSNLRCSVTTFSGRRWNPSVIYRVQQETLTQCDQLENRT